jgi:glycine cleavage system H protein
MTEYLETIVNKFIFKVASDRLYTAEGVWALQAGDQMRVGLSDFLQQRSGDIAFVEPVAPGKQVKAGDEIAIIETIKVNVSLMSPLSGTVTRVNPQLETTPDVLNQDPYGEGWLCEIEAGDWAAEQVNLLDAPTYFARMKREAEEETNRP